MSTFLHTSRRKAISIFAFAFLLYVNTIRFDYVQDDAIVISENMFTQQGVQGIAGLFQYDTFYGFFKEEGKEKLVQGGRYRPASVASFAIEHSIFGGNPHISHLINIVLYALLCVLLFYLTKLLLSNHIEDKLLENIAWFIALLFAAHPIHVEVVANIKGRDEIFVGLFGLLSIYLLFAKERAWWKIALAYICALIAFFSKENAIIFLIIIPLTVWFFGDKRWNQKALWLTTIPILFLASIYLFVRFQILGASEASASTELMNNPFLKFDGTAMVPYGLGEKWATITYNLGKYLQLMLFPFPLTSDYYPYHITAKSLANPWVILSAISHGALIVAGFFGTLKKKPWAYGILFYLGFLFLVSNVPFSIGTNISERFLFIPSIGFIFSFVYVSYLLGLTQKNITKYIAVAVLLLFSIYTVYRSNVWKDDFTLLTTDVNYSNNSAKALHGAAGALSTRAANLEDIDKQRELIILSNQYLTKALKIYPFYNNAYLIQGNNFYYLKKYDQAINSYEDLLKRNPENQNALKNLQITLRDAGRHYGEVLNDLDKSIGYLQQAYQLDPTDYEAVRLLGVSNGIAGRDDLALRYFMEGTDLRPKDGYAWLNAGNAAYRMGDEATGQRYHQKAVELDASLGTKIRNNNVNN